VGFCYVIDIFEQSTRVARRLQFDNDEMNTDVNNYISDTNNIKELCSTNNIDIVPPDIQTTVASYSQQKNDKNDIFQTMVESLTTRGFIVKKNYLDSQQSNLDNTKEEVTEDSNILSICGQFECLSVLEGIVYSVQAANKKNNSQINSVKILATVGSHPNIISYFSSWTDARFHYVQMELCQKNVYSVSHQLNNAVDFRTVLEHISCALHYLHDIKKYTHNKVNQWNIYQTMGNDTDCVVYKLGGFCSASKLSSPSETLVDIGSLCLTVLQLLKNRYEDFDINEDTSTLRSYLALVKDNVDSSNITSIWINGNNAFPEFTANRYIDARSIWRWCCSTRQQQLERRRRHLLAIMYQNAVCNNSNSISRTDSD